MGNHDLAVKDFLQAIEIDPTYASAYYHMATSKFKDGKVREAIEDFKRSQELDDNPGIYDGLGCCYHALKQYDEAINEFNTAIEKKPRNVEFLKNRAQCFYDMGQYQSSIDDLETALEINDKDPQVLYKQGLSYFTF